MRHNCGFIADIPCILSDMWYNAKHKGGVYLHRLKSTKPQTRALFMSAVLSIFLGIAYFVMQKITFETNDDTAMAQLIYGLHTDYYDPHLVFINVILGYALKACLLVSPTIPWYTVFHCGTVLLAFFVLMYLLVLRTGIRKGMLPVLLLIFFFGKEFCLTLQFSKTAGIAAAAGILLLLDAALDTEKRPYWKWILGGLLTIIGSLYRFNAFCMVLIPAAGIGMFLILKPLMQKDWKRLLRICLPFVIVFAVCFGCRFYNAWEYQRSAEWAHYIEFNSLRSELLDYGFPDYIENQDLYQSLNISYSDYEMYKQWDFADPEIFSVDAMKQLVAAKTARPLTLYACMDNLYHFFFSYRYSVAVLVALAVTLITTSTKHGWQAAYAVFAVVAAQVYLYISGRYGLNRVDAVLAIALFAILVLYGWGQWEFSGKITALVMSVLVLLSPFYEFRNKATDVQPAPLYELIYSNPDDFYFCSIPARSPSIPSPYQVYPVGYRQNYSPLGGWTTYMVSYLEKWEQYNITNPFRDMVDNPNIFLIASGDIHAKVLYLNKHYGTNVVGRCVKMTEDGYAIYRMTTSENPPVSTDNAVFANSMENIHYGISAYLENGNTVFYGHLYADDVNSFAANVYVGITDTNGNEVLYYSRQYYSDSFGDLYNGAYGSFRTTDRVLNPDSFVNMYLEVDDTLYCVRMGTISQIMLASPNVPPNAPSPVL